MGIESFCISFSLEGLIVPIGHSEFSCGSTKNCRLKISLYNYKFELFQILKGSKDAIITDKNSDFQLARTSFVPYDTFDNAENLSTEKVEKKK